MKINKIYIFSFGKLKDRTIDFSNGFNLIYGENENGKTTIMEFVKMMFYGSKGRGSDISKNTRVKYKPWDNSDMSGKIYFEHSGKSYCLERDFSLSNSTDTIVLSDTDTGISEKLTGKENLGERFFGLGFDAFEKTIFINNTLSFDINNEADGEINSKLSNISATGDENISFEMVKNRLQAAMDSIKTPKRRGGSLAKLENELEQIKEQKAANLNLNLSRDALDSQIASKQEEADRLDRLKKEYFEQIKNAEKGEKIEKLKEFIDAASNYEQIEATLKSVDGSLIDKSFLEEAKQKISIINEISSRLSSKNNDMQNLVNEIATLENNSAQAPDTSPLLTTKTTATQSLASLQKQSSELSAQFLSMSTAKKSNSIILFILMLVLGIIGIAAGAILTFIFEMFSFISFSVLGVALIVVGFLLRKPNKDSGQLAKIEQSIDFTDKKIISLQNEITKIDDEIKNIQVNRESNKLMLDNKREEALKRQSELLEIKEKHSALLSEFFTFFSHYKPVSDIPTASDLINKTEQLLSDLNQAKIKAEYASRGSKCTTREEAEQKLAILGSLTLNDEIPLAELQEKLKQASDNYAEISLNLATLKTRMQTEFVGIKSPAELDNLYNGILSEYNEQNEYYELLETASTVLDDAFALLRRNFGGAVEKRALNFFSKLTGEKYTDISVSKNFEMRVTGNDGKSSKEIEYLSRGAFEQAYFSLRLALSELMSDQAIGLPIMLDDVFSQYDDARLYKGFEFLSDYAKQNQVIFFTCHNICRDISDKLGANIINI